MSRHRRVSGGPCLRSSSKTLLTIFLVATSTLAIIQYGHHPVQAQAPPTAEAQPKAIKDQVSQTNHQDSEGFFSLRALFGNTTTSGQQRAPFSDRKCLMCRFSVSLINYALKTRRGHDQIDKIANSFCTAAHLESPLVCSQVSKLFNREITKVLTYGLVTPNQVCGLLSNNSCGHFHSPLDDWEVSLEASHLFNQSAIAASRDLETKYRQEPNYRVIHISDTHIDLKYTPGSAARCQEPLCCQRSSTPLNDTTQQALKAGYWGTYGSCDIPLRTFEATLEFINATLQDARDIEYIIWTGDIQPHDVWQQNKKTAIKIYDTVFAKIFEHLPNVKILPTLGNHEMIPVDSFSPSNLLEIARDDSPVWLYKKLDSFWSRWLPKNTKNTITKDGFYAAHIREGLKVISLNTNFCHSKNFWLFINSTDPGSQLQWLVHELQMSELIHEKVHIIGHIPPGSEDCMRVWSKNYNRILRRFNSTITGQFFGHTHYNEFEMFYDEEHDQAAVMASDKNKRETQQQQQQMITSLSHMNTTSMPSAATNLTNTMIAVVAATKATLAKNITLTPIKVAFIGPSITTFINLNPSFRIYNIEPKRDFMPTDFETYFMNLTSANANETQQPEWTSAGMFSKVFGIDDTFPESMHALLVDIANDFKDVDDDDDDPEGDTDENNDKEVTTTTTTTTTTSTTTTNKPEAQNSTAGKKENAAKDDEDDDDALDGDDRLYELYWLYNSYSDAFNRSVYDQIAIEDKRKFLCRMLTGQSHDLTACDEFLPVVTTPKLSSSLVNTP